MEREKIIINDVGPRDGLQNQAKVLSVDERLQLIHALLRAGLTHIEIGAFVSPKAVPAMAGTDELAQCLLPGKEHLSALIPNRRGYDLAHASGVRTMGLVVAASETMNQRNIRMGTEDVLAVSREVIAQGRADGNRVLAYVATAWECPFEGEVSADAVHRVCDDLLAAGATEIVLADTIGAASPDQVRRLLPPLIAEYGVERLSCHFHDTRGMGVADVYAAVECGIRKFDASVGGLGGCPFAPGATGNVATEDVVVMLRQMGFDTGVDLAALLDAVDLVIALTGNCEGGRAINWIRRQREEGLL